MLSYDEIRDFAENQDGRQQEARWILGEAAGAPSSSRRSALPAADPTRSSIFDLMIGGGRHRSR